jgi:hypothetical protein
LIVGIVIDVSGVNPSLIIARLRSAFEYVRTLSGDRVDSAGDLVGYVLVGAVVVVPIWLLSLLVKALRRRS